MTPSEVAVIVLNWNGLKQTANCCRSLTKLDYPNVRIWVVDNGSTADLPEELERACPGATVLRLPENRGFAGGVNAGIRAALERPECGYVWLFNNDAICDANTLTRLVEAVEEAPEFAAAGSCIEEGIMGKNQRIIAGMRLAPPLYLPCEAKEGEPFDYLSGACLLIKRQALEKIGWLDEGYFFFFEDADFCTRVRQQGWKLALARGTMVYHEGSATIGRLSRLRAMYYRCGHVRYLRKHVRHPLWPAALCLAWRLGNDVLRRHWESIRGSLQGWRQGWTKPV